jgi:2-polyprenyl-6-methoxyphenol hydroxylase-like FAD-dependent oxidoreductase
MRILIAGAGIGGMALAALLVRWGVRPTLVEKAPSFEHAGYMLGLWPLGSRVLHGLGLYERFAGMSVEAKQYEVRDGHGALIKRWSMEGISERFGPVLSCTRPQLVELLRSALGEVEIRFGTAVEGLEQNGAGVRVILSDGSDEAYDLIIGADGMHSRVRALLFGTQPYTDTGWGGWVWWADAATNPADTLVEYWGAGRFLGAYPTTRGIGIFAGAPREEGYDRPGEGRQQRIRDRFAGLGAQVDSFLEALPADDAEMFFWELADVRSAEWVHGRVVLLGDAAAGFLPTAGIGASMALESAAVLADELSRAGKTHVEHALRLYVKRRRRRVESIQDDSRKLATMMFVKSGTIAAVRDLVTRFYSLEMLASQIAKAFDAPI